jgi:hypothetical protein
MVLLMAACYLSAQRLMPETAGLWLMFSYLVMAFCGLLLVLQPVPGGPGAKPHASPGGKKHAA